jgi:ferredoxin--NADP+ reductase/benzoate/toluate 1,2-dioxygenase reductase subunit
LDYLIVKHNIKLIYFTVTIEDRGSETITAIEPVVTQIRHLTENTFILRFTRGDMEFRAGQHIIVGLHGELDQREYSIYSGEIDDYLEILVKEVVDGSMSVKLKQCKPGQLLNVNGPFGSFGVESFDRYARKLVFIATGTGISPFHSFVRSYPGMDYTLLHGVSLIKEAYERSDYDASRYSLYTSKEHNSGWIGRVTKYLPDLSVTSDMLFYLCGNGRMISDAYNILRAKGIPAKNIFSERYF